MCEHNEHLHPQCCIVSEMNYANGISEFSIRNSSSITYKVPTQFENVETNCSLVTFKFPFIYQYYFTFTLQFHFVRFLTLDQQFQCNFFGAWRK